MSRPPSGTDLKLKAAGRKLLQEKGITGLTVREACRVAGVNTGMFHYYFGSKEEFLKAVLKEMYAEFMLSFKAGVAVAGTPRARLKTALVEVGKFARSMRSAVPMIFADLAYGNKEAFGFFSGNFTEHISHIASLARECRSQSEVREHSVPYIVGALIPVMIFPVVISGILERNGVSTLAGGSIEKLREELFSDEGISERAEIAVRGIGL
jgi:AcrR family transcriptional regulator